DPHGVRDRLRLASIDALDDVAVLELEVVVLRRAHDEEALVGAEVASQLLRQRHELHVAPAAAAVEREPAASAERRHAHAPVAIAEPEREVLGLARLHRHLAARAVPQVLDLERIAFLYAGHEIEQLAV